MLLRSCRVIPRETHRIFISRYFISLLSRIRFQFLFCFCIWILFHGIRRSISSRKFEMAPPILSLALPSETGRVLSIQSHTVQVFVFYLCRESEVLIFVSCLVLEKSDCESEGRRSESWDFHGQSVDFCVNLSLYRVETFYG
jgi:hypothetical protein